MSIQPRQLDNYELEELLGRGGMAEVWKAYHPQLERYVAIKLLHTDLQSDPDILHRLVREARLIAALQHPNIIQIYDFQTTTLPGNTSPIAYMVMKYIEGQTLAQYIRQTSAQGRYLSGEHLLQLFTALSRAVDYAHAHKMVHRDIKPANLLLDKHDTSHFPGGEPILSDFGIARLLGTVTGTVSQNLMGTPLYISPEQAQGAPGTAYSDIYSLGVILYEMCTGVQPFRGETVTAIIFQQISINPPSPSTINPQISPALSNVILRCLDKDPLERFQTASALTSALAEALRLPVPAGLEPPAPAFGRGRSQEFSNASVSTLMTPLPPLPASMQSNGDPAIVAQNLLTPPPNAQIPVLGPQGLRGEPPTRRSPNPQPNPIPPPPIFNIDSLVQQPSPTSLPPAQPPSFSVTPPHPPQQRPQPKHRILWVGLLAFLILLLLATGVSGIYWLTHKNNAPVSNGPQVVGSVSFVSSGPTSEQNSNGENDEIIISLQNLRSPANGNAYYAWLLPDLSNVEGSSISLGKLNIANGKAHLQYSDPNYTNLLATTSRFLITEESASSQPDLPTLNRAAWRYYAEIPQTPNPQDPEHFSLLNHLRHLLAQDPKLAAINLPGGLIIWFERNTEKVLEWSGSARDDLTQGNVDGVRNQIIRVLDYLDGAQFVGQDVPPGTPLLVNQTDAGAALLEFDAAKQTPPGYVYHISLHLQGVVASPGATDAQRHLAEQMSMYLSNAKNWLQRVHDDAVQEMQPQTNLLSSQSIHLLDDMYTYALYAFSGYLDPSDNVLQGGARQISDDSQALAQFTVTPFSSENGSV